MKQLTLASGQDLREMFSAGTVWLEKHASAIDAINVFPVPDGDCGKNMLLTMRSAMEAAYQAPTRSADSVIRAIAHGALIGARGNSGVILSQIFKGLAKGLEGKEFFTAKDLAEALALASQIAYQALPKPMEGTILTVIRDIATAAEATAEERPEKLSLIFEALAKAAKESVARTPSLLPVLHEAGVVDAGGQGLYVLLDGALRYLRGETIEALEKAEPVAPSSTLSYEVMEAGAKAEEPYGYCTQFLIKGQRLNPDKIRRRLAKEGKSLMVVGDRSNVKVHIHTNDPSVILGYGLSLGQLRQISVESMDEQLREFREAERERLSPLGVAIVAVALGQGMKEVFRSSGAAAIVSGGQTMNPSVQELLTGVKAVPANEVILLPNNKNVILTASQVQELTSKKVMVIPSKTMPQGVAALLAFNSEADLKQNAEAMREAMEAVRTVEITEAVRSTNVKGLPVKKGQFIAIIDDEDLVAAGDGIAEVIFHALDKVATDVTELITIYYGVDTKPAEAKKIAREIENKYSGKQIELVEGGQPYYSYIISLE